MEEQMKDTRSPGGQEQFSRCFLYLMTFGVTLGAMCLGYQLACISGTMLYIQPEFELDTTWQSVIVGSASISAAFASPILGHVADQFGRRMTLIITAVIFIVGSVLTAAAPNKEVILAGRFVTGLTSPMPTFSLMYIAEMSPASIRGGLLTFQQVQLNIGLLLSAIVSGAFSYLPSHQWRYMFGFPVLPAVFFCMAACLLPETPRWLVAKGRHQEATRVLQRIYGRDDVSQNLKDMQRSISSDQPTGTCSTLLRIMKTPHVLRALAVGSCLAFFLLWSGFNVIMIFSGIIMKMVGFPREHAIWVQGIVPLAMFISGFSGLWAVDRFGRRPLILISLGGCALLLIMVSVGFHLTTSQVPDVHVFNGTHSSSMPLQPSVCHTYTVCDACIQDSNCGLCYEDMSGFCLPALNEHYSSLGPCTMDNKKDKAFTFAWDYCPSPYAWIVVAGIFLFCIVISPGMAALTYTVNAEIYPMWARSICITLVMFQALLWNTILSFTFLPIVETFKTYGTFWMFTALSTLGFVLLAIFLPETKNHSLEEVEELFMTSQQRQRHRQQRENTQCIVVEKEQERESPEMTRL